MIGDTDNNLLALKKASVKKRVSIKVQIDVPDNLKKTKVHVYLMADSYIGLDQALELKLKWEFIYISIYILIFLELRDCYLI